MPDTESQQRMTRSPDRKWTEGDRDQLAEVLRQHHLVLHPTNRHSAHDACACGPIVEDWDEHWAEVMLEALAVDGRLAVPGETERDEARARVAESAVAHQDDEELILGRALRVTVTGGGVTTGTLWREAPDSVWAGEWWYTGGYGMATRAEVEEEAANYGSGPVREVLLVDPDQLRRLQTDRDRLAEHVQHCAWGNCTSCADVARQRDEARQQVEQMAAESARTAELGEQAITAEARAVRELEAELERQCTDGVRAAVAAALRWTATFHGGGLLGVLAEQVAEGAREAGDLMAYVQRALLAETAGGE